MLYTKSQIEAKLKPSIIELYARLYKLDRSWFINTELDLTKKAVWVPFGNIDSMLIQRFSILYFGINRDEKY